VLGLFFVLNFISAFCDSHGDSDDTLLSAVCLQPSSAQDSYFFRLQQPPLGQDLLIYEVSGSHWPTHHRR